MRTGSPGTALIIIRGNSGSGKTSVARALREAYGRRGLALISQDVVRRDILRELDKPGAVNIGLIDTMCRHALDTGYHVIVEGILAASRYGQMLHALCRDHLGRTSLYYLDIPWEETLRRHETRPQRSQFGADDMRQWYIERDVLPEERETIFGEDASLEDIVRRIYKDAGLEADRQADSPAAGR
ncbi:kinase [Nonomuraea sp. NPDC000554]|uniref:kinase n=1 Tax=Nonomuraea sp. NPDC000554 TaxID=3154259 RepID=UPI00331B5997